MSDTAISDAQIWEAVGENKAFNELKELVQKEFELDVKISAVE